MAGTDHSTSGVSLERLKAAAGNEAAVGELLDEHRIRLRRIVSFRLDRRLKGRVDPSDILQDAYLEASKRMEDYIKHPDMPFFLWLRFLTEQSMQAMHRHHLGRQKRAADREVSIDRHQGTGDTSEAIAARLFDKRTDPGDAVAKAELFARIRSALDAMDPVDREVLALRHFEDLSNAETAEVLGLQTSAASKRYIRAVDRLREILAGLSM